MKLIVYELKKAVSQKWLIAMLAVLFAVNAVMAFIYAEKSVPKKLPDSDFSEFVELYRSDEEAARKIDETFAEMMEFLLEQQELSREAARKGEEYTPLPWTDRYAKSDAYTDRILFSRLDTVKNGQNSYEESIKNVLNEAEKNMRYLDAGGVSTADFSYQYQLNVKAVYSELLETVDIDMVYSYGWDDYFAYESVAVFLSVALVLVGAVIFSQEKHTGFLALMRIGKKGRLHTAVAKTACASLFAAGLSLLFTFSTLAVFGAVSGLSDPGVPVQSIADFALCQYRITIGQLFWITLGLRTLTCLALTAVMCALSAAFGRYYLVFACGTAFIGLNFALYMWQTLPETHPARVLNLFSTLLGKTVFTRWMALDLAGRVFTMINALMTLACLLFAAGSVLSAIIFLHQYPSSGAGAAVARVRKWIGSFRPKKTVGRGARRFSCRLLPMELFKTVMTSRLLIVVLAVLLLKIVMDVSAYSEFRITYADQLYSDYIDEYAGEWTQEKDDAIREELSRLREIKRKKEEMQSAYWNEEISYEDYIAYLAVYQDADSRLEPLGRVREQSDYLGRLLSERGIRGWFVNRYNWEKLVNTSSDLYITVLIILLLAGVFAAEYQKGTSKGQPIQVLRPAKLGGNKLYFTKCLTAVIAGAAVSVLLNSIDAALVLSRYPVSLAQAPMQSLSMFGQLTWPLQLWQYLLLMYLIRILAAVLLGLMVCSLSAVCRKTLLVLLFGSLCFLIPSLILSLDSIGFSEASYAAFLNVTALCTAGTGAFLLAVLSWTAVTFAAQLISRYYYLKTGG